MQKCSRVKNLQNQIQISRCIQVLLHLTDLGDPSSGVWGSAPCTQMHVYMLNIISCIWLSHGEMEIPRETLWCHIHVCNNLILVEDIYDLWRHPTYGWWLGWWVGRWVGSCEITKYQINLELIEITQFCLKFFICGDTCLHKWIGRLMGGSCQITKYWINLIEIIPFCLQIDDL